MKKCTTVAICVKLNKLENSDNAKYKGLSFFQSYLHANEKFKLNLIPQYLRLKYRYNVIADSEEFLKLKNCTITSGYFITEESSDQGLVLYKFTNLLLHNFLSKLAFSRVFILSKCLLKISHESLHKVLYYRPRW